MTESGLAKDLEYEEIMFSVVKNFSYLSILRREIKFQLFPITNPKYTYSDESIYRTER